MKIILATEIWGRTPHVQRMADALGTMAVDVRVVDPYDGADPAFACEEDAYEAYLKACGHEEYARRVSAVLAETDAPAFLVGLSAGAGAVWAAMCGADAASVLGACCFYGSPIRTMLDRVPAAPVDLVFPAHEPHFDVTAVIRALSQTPGTRCHVVPYGHGFMNPLSANYDAAGHEQWQSWLLARLAEHR